MIAAEAFADKPVLVGETVLLRGLWADDAPAFFAATCDPEIRRLTGTHREFTREEIGRWCATRAEHPDRLDLAIERRSDGLMVGELAVSGLDVYNGSASYRIALTDLAHAGRGYGGEATRLTLGFLFEVGGLHRVELEVFAFNARAIRAYEASGFRREGVLREALLWDGERYDVIVMAALRPEWLALFG